MSSITWHEDFDDDDNAIWVGASPYTAGGDAIYWRLKQRLRGDRIEWYAAHDAELGGETGDSWLCVDDAKDACQKAHEEIIAREGSMTMTHIIIDQYNPRQVRVWPPEAPEWCDDPDSLDEILDDAIADALEDD